MWKRSSGQKLNCWEIKGCGREPGGDNVWSLGLCPAALETKLDGVNGGRNAGRACWVIAGTFCQGQVQGVFAQKYHTCRECDFYQLVRTEERADFEPPEVLLRRLDEVLL